jgi:hypothetical protein
MGLCAARRGLPSELSSPVEVDMGHAVRIAQVVITLPAFVVC